MDTLSQVEAFLADDQLGNHFSYWRYSAKHGSLLRRDPFNSIAQGWVRPTGEWR